MARQNEASCDGSLTGLVVCGSSPPEDGVVTAVSDYGPMTVRRMSGDEGPCLCPRLESSQAGGDGGAAGNSEERGASRVELLARMQPRTQFLVAVRRRRSLEPVMREGGAGAENRHGRQRACAVVRAFPPLVGRRRI